MKTFIILLIAITVLFFGTQIYFIMAKTETQPYEVLKKENDFEIRKYPPATMATVSMNAKSYKELSSSGFRTLASFIFGGNQSKKSIAMTSPVRMDINDSQSSMSFVMPSEYTKDNLPKPDNSAIKIETTAEEYVAAIEFGGYANDEDIKKYAAQLKKSLEAKNIEYFGNFRFLGYNAPYQLLNRKNEIIVSVHWK
ncbi:SOUL family heme-binding protein [Kaistella jeonii]|uniref:SOUL heme-binding protein n=1 Tax=Kaistella jeonii TaxID=266749 RepID=A0A0C1FFB2_9FLAO|nr:heme-binding protein [Kaistella jeonii]KIA90503.1 SOUL heme-binding protein [Kaistella jeonii]SFB71726.1 SOUL heme-binding protein [Kaistella jeonii]VEI94911.1 SOUL heme-binding protein [Kaistella jeonii]